LREVAPLDERFAAGTGHVDLIAPSTGGARLVIGNQARSVIREIVGDREFRVDDAGFWQVHEHAAEALTRVVQVAVDPALFDPRAANLDLYGGVGLLAAALGRFVSFLPFRIAYYYVTVTASIAVGLFDRVRAGAVPIGWEKVEGIR